VSRGNACEETANGGQEICGEPFESYNMRAVDVFLPSGVRTRLYDALGYCPHRLSADVAARIEVLWALRNAVPEAELDKIDDAMEEVVLREAARLWAAAA
jgi:hypothetical protein